MYQYIVKQKVKNSFKLVNEHRFTELVNGMSLNVRHNFAGDHAMGGTRNDQAAVKLWMERLARVKPNLHLTINHLTVEGWPNKTLAIVRWTANAVLANGESYENHGVHFISLKWGKVIEINVYEDTMKANYGLEIQYEAGIKEAKAQQIIS